MTEEIAVLGYLFFAVGETMNIRLMIEYEGSGFKGWQRLAGQEAANTIQGRLEQVLGRMCGQTVEVIGSGRTDAGVHAAAQVANVHLPQTFDCDQVKQYMNRYLPETIRVLRCDEVSQRFHSRFHAKEKEYCYLIGIADKAPVRLRRFLWQLGFCPDVERMREAASLLLGTHNFQGFCNLKKTAKSTVRTIHSIRIEKEDELLMIRVRGDGFLKNMVRIIVGTLVEIGDGRREATEIPLLLAKRERAGSGFMAPAQGLTLERVWYD
ncbi:MAG: tRNA pseudouridine(38-40) synthase TruA [Eubacteriales bacterium]|nr:tRNA pseudouridine(38-40) synthase TruA [Eubacteriales bacterium]